MKKKTVIVDVVFVNSVMWVERWERGERGEDLRVGSCYQTGSPGGWEFITTSKKLALQVTRGPLLFFARGLKRDSLYIVRILNICMLCKYK